MIVVDTVVVSERVMMRYSDYVFRWLQLNHTELYPPTIVFAEIQWGITGLPDGKRRRSLERFYDKLKLDFADRILTFDTAAADAFHAIGVQIRHAGKQLQIADSIIASIAKAQRPKIATRSVSHFESLGVAVINPWEEISLLTTAPRRIGDINSIGRKPRDRS